MAPDQFVVLGYLAVVVLYRYCRGVPESFGHRYSSTSSAKTVEIGILQQSDRPAGHLQICRLVR